MKVLCSMYFHSEEQLRALYVPSHVNFSCLKGYIKRTYPELRSEDFFLSEVGESIPFFQLLGAIFKKLFSNFFVYPEESGAHINISCDEELGVALNYNLMRGQKDSVYLKIKRISESVAETGQAVEEMIKPLESAIEQQRHAAEVLQRTSEQQQKTTKLVKKATEVWHVSGFDDVMKRCQLFESVITLHFCIVEGAAQVVATMASRWTAEVRVIGELCQPGKV